MESKKAIVYTVDDNMDCILQMEDSIRSVRRMLGNDIDIVVCTNKPDADFDTAYGQRIVDVSKIVDELGLAHTGVMWRGAECSPMLLFRLALPLVPELEQYDKVLYLDSDTEIWSPEALKIFDFDNEGHELTAVRDSLSDQRVWARVNRVKHVMPTDNCPYYQRWDYLLATKAYVNSGVIVFDLARLRPDYRDRMYFIVDQLKARRPPYPDQDIINAYFDIYLVMDSAFNDWSAGAERCYIRHNVGGVRRQTRFYPPEHPSRPVERLCPCVSKDHCGVLSERVEYVAVLSDQREVKRSMDFHAALKDRYGITPDATVWYGPDPFLAHLTKIIPSETGIFGEYMALWHAHYRAVKAAYDGGAGSMAVFEDTWNTDTTDGPRVENAVKLLPAEYSLAVWDARVDSETGEAWHCLSRSAGSASARSSKFYMMSRKCMKTYIWLFESLLDEHTPYRRLRMVHHWFNDSLRGKQRMFFANGSWNTGFANK